jgi:transcription initiation factor TFIIIB Brf1 subunit/transcription initiation factor TFIIB
MLQQNIVGKKLDTCEKGIIVPEIYDVDLNSDDDWMNLFMDISNCSDDDEDVQLLSNSCQNNMQNHIDLEVKMDLNKDKIIKFNVCPKCNIEGKISDGTIQCESCGLTTFIDGESDKFSLSVEQDHNTSNNSFMSFNFVGKNSYCYQRSFLKTCANYSSFRKNNNRKDLYNYNYQYDGKKIPKNAIKLAIELFSKIKEEKYVFRGNGKKGVLGACLFYACVMNNITKTPREISAIMEIEERFLSQGDRTIHELNEKGVISIPTILRPLQDYLDQYFPALGIPEKYKTFVFDLIDRAEKKNIHIQNDSRTTTKSIGAIYLLTMRIKELKHINKDQIVKECGISKSTFIRYYNLLILNYKVLKPVFKKYKIPQPDAWRVKDLHQSESGIKLESEKVVKKNIKSEKVVKKNIKSEKVVKKILNQNKLIQQLKS